METLLKFLGDTLFGVGVVAVLVFAGIWWYTAGVTRIISRLEKRD